MRRLYAKKLGVHAMSHCQYKRRIRIRHWTRDLPRIREPPHIPLFLSFRSSPFLFPSIPLSLSFSFSSCVQSSFLCPPNRCSLHEIPQSILTLAVRGRLVRGCWTGCRNGDEARGMMRKKRKRRFSISLPFTPCIRPFPSAYLSLGLRSSSVLLVGSQRWETLHPMRMYQT